VKLKHGRTFLLALYIQTTVMTLFFWLYFGNSFFML